MTTPQDAQADLTSLLGNQAMQFTTDMDGLDPVDNPPPEEEFPADVPTDGAVELEDDSITPEPAPDVPLTVSERQRLQQLELAQQQASIQQIQGQIQQEGVQQYQQAYQQLVNEGFSEAMAQRYATTIGEQHVASRNREMQTILQVYGMQQQQRTLAEQREQIAKEFRVRASDLDGITDITQMRSHAGLLKRVSDAERAAKGNRRPTPAQSFEGTATERGGHMDDTALRSALGEHSMDPSQLSDDDIMRLLNT